jgi:hypothetical protein
MPIASYPWAWKIYRDLVEGAQEYEDDYTVLTRERVVGVNYIDKLQLRQGSSSLIYSQALLQSNFDIPNLTGVAWPAPSGLTKTNAQWGWRTRRQEVRFVEGQKVEVTQDWVYAQWSTFLYKLAT